MNYILSENSVSFVLNSKTHIIKRSDSNFHPAIGIIYDPIFSETEKMFKLTQLVDDVAFIESYFNLVQSLVNRTTNCYGTVPFNSIKKLISHSEKHNIQFDFIAALINNLVENPKASTIINMFLDFELLLTPEGNFYFYKGVRKDFTDVYSGKILNRAGRVIEMDENLIVPGYGPGLHFGNRGFAERMAGYDGHVNLNEVNVNDIVYLYGSEIKVKKYKVIEENSEARPIGVYEVECVPYEEPKPKEITVENTFMVIRDLIGL